jgi:hypothetical protein
MYYSILSVSYNLLPVTQILMTLRLYKLTCKLRSMQNKMYTVNAHNYTYICIHTNKYMDTHACIEAPTQHVSDT